jgi:hypothetical protein
MGRFLIALTVSACVLATAPAGKGADETIRLGTDAESAIFVERVR